MSEYHTGPPKPKSLVIAYFWWAIGGLFGWHLIYLHRDYHVLAHWISFGGYFGLGWLRDSWRLPAYVAEYNQDPAYLNKLISTIRYNLKPSSGILRIASSIIVANILGYLVMGAIPHELWCGEDADPVEISSNSISKCLIAFLAPLGCAMGKRFEII